jgi:hypothetical protein
MSDPALVKSFQMKRRQLLNHPLIRERFGEVLSAE